MIYSKERLNNLFEEVISIVDSCMMDKDLNSFKNIENIKTYLYLSFTGFLIYYGDDYFDIIYDSFKKTNFYSKTDNVADNPALLVTNYRFYNNKLSFNDTIFIDDSTKFGNKKLLNFFIHELNHLINSKNNRIIEDTVVRSGISLYDTERRKYTNRALNEALNTLQSKEIENIIYNFYDFDISVPYFYNLNSIDNLDYDEYTPYPITTYIIKDLFNNEEFNKKYKKNSLEGNIDSIINDFDEKTYRCGFIDLSDLIESCNNNISIEEQKDTIVKAKTLVKRYLMS